MAEIKIKIPGFISRPLYLDKTDPFIGTPVIKVFTGQRRVGKSYLLFQIMDRIIRSQPDARILYVNPELYAFRDIRNDGDLYRYITTNRKKSGKTSVFIDEIQDIPGFEKALRSLFAEGDYDIYCTGSNSKLMSGELATFLSGRFVEMHVHSLTWPEFLTFHNLEDTAASLERFVRMGGLPSLAAFPDREDVSNEYLSGVKDTILLRDIVERHNVRNVSFLKNLSVYLADNVGNIVSAKKISDYLKSQQVSMNVQTILDYLGFLQSSFMLRKVRRYGIEGKKIFESGDKYYFEDLGIRHAIIPYVLRDKAKVLENLVFHHLDAMGYEIFTGRISSREIDFVAKKRDKTLYFQVSVNISDEITWKREYENLLDIPDSYPKYIITMDDAPGADYKGIVHLPVRTFLTQNW